MSELSVCVEKIQEQVSVFKENAEKQINSGNKSAGVRARKASNELTKLMKEFRAESNAFEK